MLIEVALAFASLLALLRPVGAAKLLFFAGIPAALSQGAFASPLYSMPLLGLDRRRTVYLHAALLYLASAFSQPATSAPLWTSLLVAAAALLLTNAKFTLSVFTAIVAVRMAAGAFTGDIWSWSPYDVALAAAWLLAWAAAHGGAPSAWGAYSIYALALNGVGGVLLAAVSAALAVWDIQKWRPPYSPLGVAAVGSFLLSLLAVGSAIWLHKADVGIFGNAFIDLYGPLIGAAALGAVATFIVVARGITAALPIPALLAFSVAVYILGARIYPESSSLTNVLMPVLASASFYAAVLAAIAKKPPWWRAVHAAAFLALGLLSLSGPYLYNPGYVKFVIAPPGSVVWTLEPPPYPAKVELASVTYEVAAATTFVNGCGAVPGWVEARLHLAVDAWSATVVIRYGAEEALGTRPPLGVGLAGDYLIIAGPVYGEGFVSVLSSMYWNATGGCLGRGGEAPEEYLIGLRPLPFFTLTITAVVATAILAAARRR